MLSRNPLFLAGNKLCPLAKLSQYNQLGQTRLSPSTGKSVNPRNWEIPEARDGPNSGMRGRVCSREPCLSRATCSRVMDVWFVFISIFVFPPSPLFRLSGNVPRRSGSRRAVIAPPCSALAGAGMHADGRDAENVRKHTPRLSARYPLKDYRPATFPQKNVITRGSPQHGLCRCSCRFCRCTDC